MFLAGQLHWCKRNHYWYPTAEKKSRKSNVFLSSSIGMFLKLSIMCSFGPEKPLCTTCPFSLGWTFLRLAPQLLYPEILQIRFNGRRFAAQLRGFIWSSYENSDGAKACRIKSTHTPLSPRREVSSHGEGGSWALLCHRLQRKMHIPIKLAASSNYH
jgi:hypothetical protein